MTVKIFVGDCRPILRTLPAGYVQSIITSPPYWNLRDYSLPPVVWGGDSECEHDWQEKHVYRSIGEREYGSYDGKVGRGAAPTAQMSSFCAKCGAWLGSLGLEPSPEMFIEHLVEVFREAKRVLRDDGTLWLNLGDSFTSGGRKTHGTRVGYKRQTNRGMNGRNDPARMECPPGLKPKDLVMIPFRAALALQADGWWVRQTIIWSKPNGMPESVGDRPTTSHEYVFLLAKSEKYFYDTRAIREAMSESSHGGNGSNPGNKKLELGQCSGNTTLGQTAEQLGLSGRNKRSVWTVPTAPFAGAHFATFPPDLVEPMIKAGTSERGCCPACGAAWVRLIEKTTKTIPVESRNGRQGHNGQPPQQSGWYWQPPGVQELGWQPSCDCPPQDPIPSTVLDPFFGAGTVGLVADRLGRDCIGIELNPKYVELAEQRIKREAPLLAEVEVL